MEDVRAQGRMRIGNTALGRLLVRVNGMDNADELTLERRFGSDERAREWCQRAIGALAPNTEVLEVTVLVESWRTPTNWDVATRRPVTESVQSATLTDGGALAWAEPHDVPTH